MEVPTATTLVNGCTDAPATQLGATLPGAGTRTATGSGVCRVTFGSSNATAQLRIGQADGTGTAMGLGIEPPTLLARSGAPGRTYGVFGYDASRAWAAGRASTLYRTSDGGGSWSELSTPSGDNVDVEAVPGSPGTWWVVGSSRAIWRTTDAWAATPAWSSMATPLGAAGWTSSASINSIAIPDATTMLIGGDSRRLAVQDMAAGTWTVVQHTNLSVGNILAVDALDNDSFIAVGDNGNGRILMTDTKGLTSDAWSVAAAPNTQVAGLLDVDYAAASRAYVVGKDGYVASWNGTAWTDRSAAIATALDLVGVDSVPGSPDTVVVVDEAGGRFRSTDAGATWNHLGLGTTSRLGDVHFATPTVGFVAGAERSLGVSTDAGAAWSVSRLGAGETLADVAASPVNGTRLLAVGAAAWRSTNAGDAWTRAATGVATSLHGVTLADDARGWAVGERGTILHTADLGATWTTQSPPTTGAADLTDVAAVDWLTAVAVGHAGTIRRTTNGGQSWVTVASGTSSQLTGIDAHGQLLVVTGARGRILRSEDGGATWTTVAPGSAPSTTTNLVDVDMASPLVGYAAATGQQVWRTADGGATWSALTSPTGTRNRAIAASGSTVVVVGLDGSVARSTDAGLTFQQATAALTLHLAGVAAVDPHRAVLVGADTLRYRMDAIAAATAQVADWSSPTNDWDSGGFFGVCLQAVGGAASPNWTVDATNVAGTCEALDSDPWRAVPATTATGLAAQTTTSGTGSVDLVWGFRAKADQAPGTYEAGIVFEAIAP